jgi:hypothetical protein
MSRPLALVAAAAALTCAAPAVAGPPYVTDDPQPTDRGHWEVYNFVSGAHVAGDTSGAAGFDINYGAARDLQLTLVIPAAYDTADGGRGGLGAVEAAAKYKILHQSEGGWLPDLAVFPRVFLPTASARFASTHVNLSLPVWAQKDFGPWSVFGGGGWQFNPGAGNRDFWQSGLAVTRTLSERLTLGAEVFHRTRDAVDAKPLTGVNVGLTYKLTDHWALLASGGPGIQNAREAGESDFYVALEATY